MPLTLHSFPEWTPEILRKLYISRQEQQQDISSDGLLEKMVSDPRMESVWKAVTKRTDDSEYPLSLFIGLAVLIWYPKPEESPTVLKNRYSEIADLATRLEKAMKDSILEREGLFRIVSGIALSANNIAKSVDISFQPYLQVIQKFGEHPERTMLARKLYMQFKREFGKPLWATIASLVEIVCDAPSDEITVEWVRSCCRGGA
jgi:predicted regulator of amino acid metabolism with ACT domain